MSPRFPDHKLELPADVWAQVAKRLSIVDKMQLAQVCHSAAEGVQQAWSAVDYFAAAQRPDKPKRLRVAHGPAAPGDSRAWLSLTQQMHFSMSAGGQPNSRKPVMTLMRLAQTRTLSGLTELGIWPQFEEALTAASRPYEAAIFTGLMQDHKALKMAIGQGNLPTVERLLAADMPVPEATTLKDTLDANPHLVPAVADALLKEGRSDDLAFVFAEGNAAVRTEILDTSAFGSTDLCLKFFEEAAGKGTAEPLAHLMASCSPEQVMRILTLGARPGEAVGMNCMIRLAAGRPHPVEAERLSVMLPLWIGAGGDPVEIMLRYPFQRQSIAVLDQNGACPTAALDRLTRRHPVYDSIGSCQLRIKALLDYGARLTYEQFAAFVERHSDKAGNFGDRYGFNAGLELFKSYGAIPYADGSFGSHFSVQEWHQQVLVKRQRQSP